MAGTLSNGYALVVNIMSARRCEEMSVRSTKRADLLRFMSKSNALLANGEWSSLKNLSGTEAKSDNASFSMEFSQ